MKMIGENILLILISLYFSEIQEKGYPFIYGEIQDRVSMTDVSFLVIHWVGTEIWIPH